MIEKRYYKISISDSIIPESFRNKHKYVIKNNIQNMTVFFEKKYKINNKISYIFTHRLLNKESFFHIAKILTLVSVNFSKDKQNILFWETHIYEDRFEILEDFTPVIINVINKFKSLIHKSS